MPDTQLIQAPASDASCTYETLGYVEAYDAPINLDYAFVAYKETDRSSGDWRVRVKSSAIAGGVFEPAMMRSKARETGAQGKPYFTWGPSMEPTAGDPRLVEFRVHQQDGKASAIEIVVRMRKFDHSPDETKSCTFPWPA